LETLIRLSTAHAKARLSMQVEECDVEAVSELLNYVLYHEVGIRAAYQQGTGQEELEELEGSLHHPSSSLSKHHAKSRQNKRSLQDEEDDDDEEEGETSLSKKQRRDDSDSESESRFSLEEEEEEESNEGASTPLRPSPSSSSLLLPDGTANRRHPLYTRATELISSLGSSFHSSELKSKLPSFVGEREVSAILRALQDDNRVFYSEEDGMVDLI
jgi:hypothetical protein